MLRDIITITLSFSAGIAASSFYFYHIHPEHTFVDDIPLIRKDIDNTVNRGKEIHDKFQEDPATATQKPQVDEGTKTPTQ